MTRGLPGSGPTASGSGQRLHASYLLGICKHAQKHRELLALERQVTRQHSARHDLAWGCVWGARAHLPRLLHSLLGVTLHLVAGVVGDLGHWLLEDGCRLPDREGRVQVGLALQTHTSWYRSPRVLSGLSQAAEETPPRGLWGIEPVSLGHQPTPRHPQGWRRRQAQALFAVHGGAVVGLCWGCPAARTRAPPRSGTGGQCHRAPVRGPSAVADGLPSRPLQRCPHCQVWGE